MKAILLSPRWQQTSVSMSTVNPWEPFLFTHWFFTSLLTVYYSHGLIAHQENCIIYTHLLKKYKLLAYKEIQVKIEKMKRLAVARSQTHDTQRARSSKLYRLQYPGEADGKVPVVLHTRSTDWLSTTGSMHTRDPRNPPSKNLGYGLVRPVGGVRGGSLEPPLLASKRFYLHC